MSIPTLTEKRKVPAVNILLTIRLIEKRLTPACDDILIVGSLRRGKSHVSDAEIVVLPKYATDLFGDISDEPAELNAEIARLIKDEVIAYDQSVKRNGEKYKRFILLNCQDLPLEIFIADERNFGNLVMIRTGDWEFSKAMVTQKSKGGLMPDHLQQADGYLVEQMTGKTVPCRTELDFFKALGFNKAPDPVLRDAQLIKRARERK